MTDVLVKPAFQSTFPDTGDPTTFGPTAWNAARLFSAGADGQSVIRDAAAATGASWAERSRVLTVSTVQTGTDANTNEKDLWSYSLPANTLNANGRGLRITVWGSTAANANAKSYRLYFGATQITFRLADTSLNTFIWRAVAVVIRTGAATQISDSTANQGPANSVTGATIMQQASPTETLSGAITIKVTGQNGVAAANDVLFKSAIVELLN